MIEIRYNGRPRNKVERTMSNIIKQPLEDRELCTFSGCLFVYDEEFENYFNGLYSSLEEWLRIR